MDSLYLLIPIALVFCIVTIRLLLWAINSGQYDDLDKEASRILLDEDEGTGERDAGVRTRDTSTAEEKKDTNA